MFERAFSKDSEINIRNAQQYSRWRTTQAIRDNELEFEGTDD